MVCVKYWEIIADNLSKAGSSWGCVSAIDQTGERSGLRTRMATESVSSCVPRRFSVYCGGHALRRVRESNDACYFQIVAILLQFCGVKRVSHVKAAAICLSLTCAAGLFASATTIIVTNTNDNGAGSLRQALVDANDGDTIDATGISGVITLTTGELLVDKSVTINGAGADVLAIDGNAASVVFFIFRNRPGETVTISGLTIRNGRGGSFGGGIENAAGL